jgi:hypothetical protein
LEAQIIETLLAGHHEWRRDLAYPESHSDMQGAVRALLRMFEVKRRPIAMELEYEEEAVPKERASASVTEVHCTCGYGLPDLLIDATTSPKFAMICPECGEPWAYPREEQG